jgi:LacI family transcriptional regulator
MKQRMTIHDFAREIGVSTGTIYRAINNRADINPKTREMVLRKMRELDWRPSRTAQALATGQRFQAVSVWLLGLSGSYPMEILHRIWPLVQASGYELIIRDISSEHYQDTTRAHLRHMEVDGIIVVDGNDWAWTLLEEENPHRVPAVAMGRITRETLDSVNVDLGTGTVETVRHLARQGARRIVYLVPAWFKTPGDERHDSYLKVMRELGIEPEFLVQEASLDRADTLRLVRDYLAGNPAPGAFFCFNDDLAIGAYRALREAGLRVPDDVLIAGCDDIEEAAYLEHPLSTIHIPIREMCAAAWECLASRITEPSLPLRHTSLPARLVVRDTSDRSARQVQPSA